MLKGTPPRYLSTNWKRNRLTNKNPTRFFLPLSQNASTYRKCSPTYQAEWILDPTKDLNAERTSFHPNTQSLRTPTDTRTPSRFSSTWLMCSSLETVFSEPPQSLIPPKENKFSFPTLFPKLSSQPSTLMEYTNPTLWDVLTLPPFVSETTNTSSSAAHTQISQLKPSHNYTSTSTNLLATQTTLLLLQTTSVQKPSSAHTSCSPAPLQHFSYLLTYKDNVSTQLQTCLLLLLALIRHLKRYSLTYLKPCFGKNLFSWYFLRLVTFISHIYNCYGITDPNS